MSGANVVSELGMEALMDAALVCCGEYGHLNASVAEISRRCGTEPSVFSRYFTGSEECLERAYAMHGERLLENLLSSSGDAYEKVERALGVLADFILEDPPRARAVLLEARLIGRPPFQRRPEFLKRLSDCLDAACRREAAREAPAISGVFLVRGIEQTAIQALARNRPEDFIQDIPGLLCLVVGTYGLPTKA